MPGQGLHAGSGPGEAGPIKTSEPSQASCHCDWWEEVSLQPPGRAGGQRGWCRERGQQHMGWGGVGDGGLLCRPAKPQGSTRPSFHPFHESSGAGQVPCEPGQNRHLGAPMLGKGAGSSTPSGPMTTTSGHQGHLCVCQKSCDRVSSIHLLLSTYVDNH